MAVALAEVSLANSYQGPMENISIRFGRRNEDAVWVVDEMAVVKRVLDTILPLPLSQVSDARASPRLVDPDTPTSSSSLADLRKWLSAYNN